MRTLLHTDGSRTSIGSVKRRLMTARTAHIPSMVSRDQKIATAKFDAFSLYRKLRAREILGQRLEDLLRLFRQRSVLCRGRGKQDREARGDARRIEMKAWPSSPSDGRPARGSESGRVQRVQF